MNELQLATLGDLESKIEVGLKTFFEIGLCLIEIRDRKLYKEQGYSRFNDYCKIRWGWNDSRARQLIGAVKTVTIVTHSGLTPPKTESQVRELTPLIKINEQEAIETWQELQEEHGENITAEIIRDAVQEKLKPVLSVPIIHDIISEEMHEDQSEIELPISYKHIELLVNNFLAEADRYLYMTEYIPKLENKERDKILKEIEQVKNWYEKFYSELTKK